MFENRMVECIKAFKSLLNSNNYIGQKEYLNYLEEYRDVFSIFLNEETNISDKIKEKIKSIKNYGSNIIERTNRKFLEEKLVEYKDYFDNMFKNIDENIILDTEQRKTIISDEDYTLVVAGAGSGKTTTMAAKVKYLVDKKKIDVNKIIVLAFTNKAKKELEDRINNDFKIPVSILTFHKLGIKFIRHLYNKPIKVASDVFLEQTISDYVKEVIFSDKDKLKEMMKTFKKYVSFDSSSLLFDNFNDYFEYYVNNKYEKYKNSIKELNENRINNRIKNNFSINGEFVKSKGEVLIANYLYINGYKYEYESLYPYFAEEKKSYSPDFTIFDDNLNVYVEYYGMATYDKDGSFSSQDIKEYNRILNKKKVLHYKYGTNLIELYSEYQNKTNYLKVLNEELFKYNIAHNRRSDKEIFYRLEYTNQEIEFFKFLKLVKVFIRRYKDKTFDKSSYNLIFSRIKDEELKKQFSFVIPIYEYYEKTLREKNMIDFSDMINYAYSSMKLVKDKNENMDYEYLLIDEYQDISLSRYNLVTRLANIFDAKIVAVGDDWQSIFGFSGSDVELFTHFYELMGYANIIKITNTYRNSQELLDIAGDFVQKNTNQLTKELVSNKHLDKPVKIIYYDETDSIDKVKQLVRLIEKIYKTNNESKILLLGRYNEDIEDYLYNNMFKMHQNGKIIYSKNTNINIEFLTIHEAKGLGYDEVILLNAVNRIKGFPSKIVDEPLLKVLNNYIQDEYGVDYPEERRLFYVALTRTKNNMFILCPYLPLSHRSDFVVEIEENKNVESFN